VARKNCSQRWSHGRGSSEPSYFGNHNLWVAALRSTPTLPLVVDDFWWRFDALLFVCGSLCRGGQLKLLGLYVVDSGVEMSLVGFEGIVVVGEGGEAGALVVEFVEDGGKGGGDAFPPLIFLEHGLGSAEFVS
jgi:hypothetical protein